MDKKKKIILFVILFIVILLIGYFVINSKKDVDPKTDSTITEEEENEIVEEKNEITHNLKMTIVSPEEDTFSAGQARMYDALVEGNAKYTNQIKCHWEFFLNQNNEETLYQVMDNTGTLSGESKNVCKFTSTFIESTGVLRVKLTITVFDYTNDNIESISAERTYTVL